MNTILMIDDDPRTCFTVKRWLEFYGNYRVLTATTPQAGLRTARRSRPDLILLDVVMPRMSGIEVLQRLKACARTRYTPVIILTGSPSAQTLGEAMFEYAEHYLTKPADMAVIQAKIAAILKRRGACDGDESTAKRIGALAA